MMEHASSVVVFLDVCVCVFLCRIARLGAKVRAKRTVIEGDMECDAAG